MSKFDKLYTKLLCESSKNLNMADENPYNMICPCCDTPAQASCKCKIGDKTCKNGHHFRKDSDGNIMMMKPNGNYHRDEMLTFDEWKNTTEEGKIESEKFGK